MDILFHLADCRGRMKPDTPLDEKARQLEVSDDQTITGSSESASHVIRSDEFDERF